MNNLDLFELVKLMNNGNSDAKKAIIVQSMGLIKKCVSEIKSSNLDYEDLVQEAVLILLNTLPKFDPSKGSLSTFIWSNVKMPLICSKQGMPVRLYKLSRNIAKTKQYLFESGKPASLENIAAVLGLSASKLNKYVIEINKYNHIYLDQSASSEEDSDTIGSLLADTSAASPEENCLNNFASEELRKYMQTLSAEQRRILTLHYNLNNSEQGPLSFRQIAAVLGTKHQNVAYTETVALKKLRSLMLQAA